MRLDAVPVALARLNYRVLRIPLPVIEVRGMSRIDEQAPARLAFEHFLIHCDRAAAHLLGDKNAAARAATPPLSGSPSPTSSSGSSTNG